MNYQNFSLRENNPSMTDSIETKVTKIVLRNDSFDNWDKVKDTIILAKGEPAIEFNENNIVKIKIGDGQHTWKELPYLVTESNNTEGGGEIIIPNDIQQQINALEQLVNSFDVRIQNAESGANAAVLASEEIRATVDQLLIDIAAFIESQNTP